jgi:hypothetical protein
MEVTRCSWIGFIQRMNEIESIKRIADKKPEGRRKIGRLKIR